MTAWIIRIILILIVIRIAWRFVHAILEGAGMIKTPEPRSVKLVRDPVCGVYVLPGRALTSGSGASAKYFCSEKCRREWSGR